MSLACEPLMRCGIESVERPLSEVGSISTMMARGLDGSFYTTGLSRWPALSPNFACGSKVRHDHLFSLFPRVARKKRKPKEIFVSCSPSLLRARPTLWLV